MPCIFLNIDVERGKTLANFLKLIQFPILHPLEQHRKISQRFAAIHDLPSAVGIVDGTPINFAQRPGIDGEVWLSRIFSLYYATTAA